MTISAYFTNKHKLTYSTSCAGLNNFVSLLQDKATSALDVEPERVIQEA